MTFQDLVDQIVNASGEDGSDTYTSDVLRWINLTRAHIADSHDWNQAMRESIELSTSNRSTGVYGIGTLYESITGSWLYDETNDQVIKLTDLETINRMDPDNEVTGQPTMWADAGMDSAGERQIRLYPRPTTTYTIKYNARLRLTDVLESDLTSSSDTYFGPILPWSSCFVAGLRYHKAIDDEEDINAIVILQRAFEQSIRLRKRRSSVAPAQSIHAPPVKGGAKGGVLGRIDPGHYNNY